MKRTLLSIKTAIVQFFSLLYAVFTNYKDMLAYADYLKRPAYVEPESTTARTKAKEEALALISKGIDKFKKHGAFAFFASSPNITEIAKAILDTMHIRKNEKSVELLSIVLSMIMKEGGDAMEALMKLKGESDDDSDHMTIDLSDLGLSESDILSKLSKALTRRKPLDQINAPRMQKLRQDGEAAGKNADAITLDMLVTLSDGMKEILSASDMLTEETTQEEFRKIVKKKDAYNADFDYMRSYVDANRENISRSTVDKMIVLASSMAKMVTKRMRKEDIESNFLHTIGEKIMKDKTKDGLSAQDIINTIKNSDGIESTVKQAKDILGDTTPVSNAEETDKPDYVLSNKTVRKVSLFTEKPISEMTNEEHTRATAALYREDFLTLKEGETESIEADGNRIRILKDGKTVRSITASRNSKNAAVHDEAPGEICEECPAIICPNHPNCPNPVKTVEGHEVGSTGSELIDIILRKIAESKRSNNKDIESGDTD